MELKRILARDSRSANEKAIKLYGRDVMIVSSQRVDNQIELVVAIESASDPEGASVGPSVQTGSTESAGSKAFGKVFHQAQLQALGDDLLEVEPPIKVQASSKPSLPDADHEARRGEEIVALLRSEIATLRDDLLLTMRTRLTLPAGSLTADVQSLCQALAEGGMPASMRLLFESELAGVATAEEAVSLIQKTLLKTLKRKPGAVPVAGRHAVVGPTGSGKTLMAARLAHLAAGTDAAHKQALISFNDTRPGAWAQLQVLSSQIGVDCYRAQDLDALRVILDDLGPKRSVWVDTGGHNFLNTVADLKSLGLCVHAVLPVDVTATHAQKILSVKDAGWSSLMLTKADEATPSWALLKCLGESHMPVAGLSDSANVKGGVLPYDPRTLIDLALAAVAIKPVADLAVPKKPKAPRSTAVRKAPVRKKQPVALTKAVHG